MEQSLTGFHSIGEESFAAGARPPLTDAPTFCVDPIGATPLPPYRAVLTPLTDGTTNFVHAFPYACISLALLYNRQPVLGVVYSPFLRRLYYAARGRGAWMELTDTNERVQLPVGGARPLRGLHEALLGACFLVFPLARAGLRPQALSGARIAAPRRCRRSAGPSRGSRATRPRVAAWRMACARSGAPRSTTRWSRRAGSTCTGASQRLIP